MHGWFLHLGLCFPVVMYGCERWTVKKVQLSFSALSGALKNCCFWTVVLEKTLENPLNCKEIQAIYPKGNQSWIFIGRTESEAPILWSPDAKSRLIGEDPDAGKDCRQEENGVTEVETFRWHHQLNGHEFEQTPGDSEVKGSLVSCSPWGCKQSDTTEQLNWKIHTIFIFQETLNQWVQFSSVAQLCPTLCNPMDCSTPSFPVLHYLLEFAQTHVHWADDAI